METLMLLKQLKKDKAITTQQFKTFRGQILSGNEAGCIKGLKRMKLM